LKPPSAFLLLPEKLTPLEHLARELGVEPARLRAALERVLFGR